MTEAHAGPSRRSVVMSLKRMPSVGKSLMSRIFARSSSTSMAQGCYPPVADDATRKTSSGSIERSGMIRSAAAAGGRKPAV